MSGHCIFEILFPVATKGQGANCLKYFTVEVSRKSELFRSFLGNWGTFINLNKSVWTIESLKSFLHKEKVRNFTFP